jgi:FixJ family two-component response regulator
LTENRTETVKTFPAKEIEKLSEQERQVVERFILRGGIARNVAREFEERLTFGQRLVSGRSKF